MKRLIGYALSTLMTFLPPRYRDAGTHLRMEAMIASCLQSFGALLFLLCRFAIFSQERAGLIGSGVNTPSNLAEVNATFGGGIFMMADFLFQPLHALLLYLVFEGLIRFLAALSSGQILGSLPLYAISAVHRLIDKAKYRKYVGTLVADEVVRGNGKAGYDIKVYSCRPKLDWNPYMTVEFEGEYYQYFREEQGDPPRRFIYRLRKNPTGRLVVVIDHYKVDDVMRPRPDRWAGSPGLLENLFPSWGLPPLVADEIAQGSDRDGFDLKVSSCRPKRDWNTYITIEFEGVWYQLNRDEKGVKSRPYLYYLRKCRSTRPAVAIRHYKVDDVLNTE